ncbi:MAG: glycosyltransferase [Dysgonamonadaceae bacterium]|jgi:glycosyltransferase involved in cell wall biosynthesis|nr:glycosyltransferase [Dysgonamonadaceae bacterium]
MKILLSNKFYYNRGGDCIYTINVESLLKSKGHEVAIFSMQHPDNFDSPYSKYFPSEIKFSPSPLKFLETMRRPLGSKEVKTKFSRLLDDFQPEIVHLNNIHSQLSPLIAEIAYNRGINVVWTLHDYKLLCPRYDCLRNGKETCDRCFTDKKQVLKNRCMKNSCLASCIAYQEAEKWKKEKLEKYTTLFIAPSQFMANKMISGGFNPNKISVLNNFIDLDKIKKTAYEKEDYYCYVGRLSPEKGIYTLVKAAQQLPNKLVIVGSGDLQDLPLHENIEYAGRLQWPKVKEILEKARFSVIPSEWYENNPLSVIESLCLGTPVLGANIGGIPELIKENISGNLFEPGNIAALKDSIKEMYRQSFDYSAIAKQAQSTYSSEKYYIDLMKFYNK